MKLITWVIQCTTRTSNQTSYNCAMFGLIVTVAFSMLLRSQFVYGEQQNKQGYHNYIATNANSLKKVKQFDKWSIYLGDFSYGKKQCYILAEPVHTKAFEGIGRNVPYIIGKYIPEGGFSFGTYLGFKIGKNKPIVLSINQQKSYSMLQYSSYHAYTYDSSDDMEITNAIMQMTNSDTISIRSYSTARRTALDIYSLSGFRDGEHYIRKLCKIAKNIAVVEN